MGGGGGGLDFLHVCIGALSSLSFSYSGRGSAVAQW